MAAGVSPDSATPLRGELVSDSPAYRQRHLAKCLFQTHLAADYGVDSQEFGQMLVQADLKLSKNLGSLPSELALSTGIATEYPMPNGIIAYRWQRGPVYNALAAYGYLPVLPTHHEEIVPGMPELADIAAA